MAVLVLCSGGGSAAFASLYNTGIISVSGAGFGNAGAILTFHSNGTEVGCVKWDGSANAYGSPCPVLGAVSANQVDNKSTTVTPTLLGLPISDASQLGIVFNPAQSGGGFIDLTQLVLTFYNPTSGAILYSASFPTCGGTPCEFVLTNSGAGTGSSGWVFQLDWPQYTAAMAAITGAGIAWNDVRIGLGANITGGTGGNETFWLVNVNAMPTPEPGSFLTMGAGLLSIGFLLRRFTAKKT